MPFGTRDSPGADIPLEPRLTAAPVQARGFGWRFKGQSRPALADLIFGVAPGDFVIVLGATGSGRTTLGRALAGVIPHRFSGEWLGSLSVDGHDVSRTRPAVLAWSVGLVNDDTVSWSLMTRAADQVALGLENRALHRAELVGRVEDALGAFDLDPAARVDSMSAGTRRRLALACAYAARPPLLVLDGPTDHLDSSRRADLLALLGEQSRRRAQTVVLIDRHATDLLELADQVLVLDDGRQAFFGPPDDADHGDRLRLHRAGAWTPALWSTSLPVPTLNSEAFEGGATTAWATPRESSALLSYPLLAASELGIEYAGPRGLGHEVALSDFNLTLRAGERVAVAGANGAGLTVLIQALAGELRPPRGSVRIGDGSEDPALDPRLLPAHRLRRLMGVVHERPPALPLSSSIYREVSGEALNPRRDEMAWTDLNQVLARFAPHLPATADPTTLSAGAARLAQVASLLWVAPGIALLDQPDVGLDRRGWDLMVELLDEMRDLGQAQLIATHDERLAATADTTIDLARHRAGEREGGAD